ncbi:MAG: DHHA1 domain-containing protein, partial [Methylohalobius sp.]
MRAGRACPGIQALLEVAGRGQEDLTAADLGFALGPRLNAAGRLQDMALGIRCLLADELAQARVFAKRLDDLNRERREIEARMQAEAMVYLESKDRDESLGVCLCDPSWHEGVIGILASRIRDRLGRPAIAFAPGGDGYLKGSARSVPEIHIRDLLAEIDALRPGLIIRYGGHAMAAGLTLNPEDYAEFASLFADQLAARMSGPSSGDLIYTDGHLAPSDFSLPLAAQLRTAGPWGQGFPEPSFHGEFEVQSAEQVKERHLKLSLRPPAGPWLEAVAFGLDDPAAWLSCRELRLVYRLDINEFRGERKLQLKVDYLEPVQ